MNNIDILEEKEKEAIKDFEEIKQKYKISNKYMLCLTYEDIGILIRIIEVLEGINTKLTKEQKDNFIPKSKVEEIIKELDKTDSKISKSLFNDDCGTWTKAIQNLLKRELLEE